MSAPNRLRSGRGRAVAACLALLACVTAPPTAVAQQIDLLLKGGHVIDPRNGIDEPRDVAIAGGRILEVAPNIALARARRVVDVSGLYVTPGIIDMHAHVFHQEAARAIKPDVFTFRSGITTVVDGGTSGWRNFPLLKEQTIDAAATRVLAFISIVGVGSAYPTTSRITTQNVADMDAVLTAFRVREYPDIIVGVKAQHYEGPDFTPVDRAVEAGTRANVPVMVDFGGHDPPLSLRTLLLEKLRPGDIYTHTYYSARTREGPVDPNGSVKPYISDAQRRGILFAVGHGGGGFQWVQAVPAFRQGFVPDIIDTDTHTTSVNGGMKDMANLMSKFLSLDMPLPDVILRTTWNPARAIKREDLGHLSAGAEADVAVFRLHEGNFGFMDARGTVRPGSKKLEAELTVRAGRIVWDLNGIAAPAWDQ
jgi:dihydroorotase